MRPPENLNLQKSVENEQMCPGVLKEWVDVIARTLSMAVEKLWQSKSSVTGGKKNKPNKTTTHAFLKRLIRIFCDLKMLGLENLRKYFPFKIINAS